jgi:GxxExxY protein
MEILHSNITNLVLKAFYGFKNVLPIELELSFFKNGLEIEMLDLQLKVETNKSFDILFKEKYIGKLKADFIINDVVAIKVVSTKLEIEENEISLMKTFLKLTKLEVALILNFGLDGQHKRIYLTNNYKDQIQNKNFNYKLNENNN